MRILTVNRTPYEKGAHQGGDETQRKMLRQHLPPDVEVIHCHNVDWRREQFQIVHAFNIILQEADQAAQIAKERGVPLVIQTIHSPGIFFISRERCAEIALQARFLFINIRREPFELAHDLGLPADVLEAKSIWIPTGAPADWYLAQPDYGVVPREPYVILAARYEDRKAQDKFLQAMVDADLKLPIYCIGDCRHPVYARCEQIAEGRPWIHLLGARPHSEIMHWFAGAAVSVLPTHYDNPGLTNLEAGITGCEVVTTEIPAIQEYLGDYAHYGRAGYPETHVAAVRTAWEVAMSRWPRRNEPLARHIRDNFTWERAGKLLYDAYQKTLH